MKVTDVTIRLSKGSSKIKAFATVVFDGILEVDSFKVVDGENGIFVATPSQRGSNGNYYNSVRMKSDELKQEITDRVLEKYNEVRKNDETVVFDEPM
ncbi:MAG: SpoVG family protein [Elusimicrobia bacterium]|nr:SpoVG family protein [Elusimicrobiota bacterium]